MAEGLSRKLNTVPDSPVVQQQVAAIVEERRLQRINQATEARALLDQMLADPVEQRARRALSIWETYIAPLVAEYRVEDRGVGEKRCAQGGQFEEWARQDAFELVTARLPPLASGEVYIRADNWDWVDQSGKIVGEVDVVVLVREDSGNERPVALLELKAHCLDVPNGWWQQARQQRAKYCIQPGEESNQSTKSGRSLPLSVPPSVPVFVITTLPGHQFLLGAQMDIVHRLGTYFGNEYRGQNPKKYPHDREVTELKAIAQELRELLGLSAGAERAMAPRDFIRMHGGDKVLFIV